MKTPPIAIVVAFLLAVVGCAEPTTGGQPTGETLNSAESASPSEIVVSAALPEIPDGARVFFTSPPNNGVIGRPLVDGKVPVDVKLGAHGVRIAPAGSPEPGVGLFHIVIDGDAVPSGEEIQADATHIRLERGESETIVMLAPGEHTMTLQLADGLHRSYGPELSASVTIVTHVPR